MIRPLADIPDNTTYDVVVAGSGAGGMAAATFAALEDAKVLLVERTEYLGGTTALSASTVWAPNTRHDAGQGDSFEKAERFLDQTVGNRSPAELRRAFLRSAPKAIAKLEEATGVQFRPYKTHPDYEQEAEGATMRGRALEPLPFDGRSLGADLDAIRPSIPEFTIFGGMMVDRTDIGHLLGMRSSLASLKHAAEILARYGLDRLKGPRGSRLVMGNALIGRFLAELNKRGVDIVLSTEATEILREGEGVSGLMLTSGDVARRIDIRKALVTATGGFNRHPGCREQLLHHPVPEHSPSAPGHTGRMQDLAIDLGGRFAEGVADNAYWAPVSIRQRPDGTTAVFPHFVMDRGKPGSVSVDQTGRRFVNESASYHRFARAMFEAHKTTPTIPCFLIMDAPALRKYGIGMVRMGTRNLKPFLDDGYLVEAPTLAALAGKLGIDATNLEASVADMNRFAETGIDTQFGRGTTPYHQVNGDPAQRPNPNLGPIQTPPFYAVRLYPGDIGAANGLVTDEHAQVLGEGDAPIGKLYACGNDARSIMGGVYPGPGITIGPAITFAYRAVQHALHGRAE